MENNELVLKSEQLHAASSVLTPEKEAKYRTRISSLEEEVNDLRQQLAYLKKALYGQKSEKTEVIMENAEQLSMFNEAEENTEEKNRIFNTVIYPALTKMIESIIRRYKLFIPDEDFSQNFNDTISYLLTKIHHFKPQITGYDLIENEKELAKHHFVVMSEEDLKQKLRDASEEDPEYVVVYFGFDDDDESNINKKYYKKETHNYKAYSYCGTVCKNYLMFKSTHKSYCIK